MTKNTKLSLSLVVALAVAGAGILLLSGGDEKKPESAAAEERSTSASSAKVIRPDSHRLDTATGGATMVEFLDFECESCGAVYPVIEQLRKQYKGKLTYAIRYFPSPGHTNGFLSSQVAEAAARQGKLEPMYKKLFETQKTWGESGDSKRDLFLDYARELGLDMKRFERDLDSPSVKARVQKDVDEGQALGVQGTPTLYLNGRLLQLSTVDQLRSDLDAAVAGR